MELVEGTVAGRGAAGDWSADRSSAGDRDCRRRRDLRAHQKGIDASRPKPGKIMLGEGEQAGRIKVLDFGLAKVVD